MSTMLYTFCDVKSCRIKGGPLHDERVGEGRNGGLVPEGAWDLWLLSRPAASQGRTRFWQAGGGGGDRNLRDADEFRREALYIHRKPVARGLVFRPASWTRPGVRWYLGLRSRPEPDADAGLTDWVRRHLLRAGHRSEASPGPKSHPPAAEQPHTVGTPTH